MVRDTLKYTSQGNEDKHSTITEWVQRTNPVADAVSNFA